MRITAYLKTYEYGDDSTGYTFLLEKNFEEMEKDYEECVAKGWVGIVKPNRDNYDKVWIDIPDSLKPEVKGNDIAIKINEEVYLLSECFHGYSEMSPKPYLSWSCNCWGLINVYCSCDLNWGYVNE